MYKGRYLLPVLMMLAVIAPQAQAETLTLDQIYNTVLERNPRVQAYKARIVAAEGNRLQQSLRPNPEIAFDADNFGGDSPRNGLEEAEYTLGISQKFESAGKRTKRAQLADLEKQRTQQEALAGIQAALAQTKASYMRVAIAQRRRDLALKRVALADKTHTTVKNRIDAAKAAEIQHTKADLEVSAAQVQLRKAEKDLSVAQIDLANLMALSALDEEIAVDLEALPDIPERETLMHALQTTPLSVMSELSVLREGAALRLAHANGAPDPVFGLGVRRFSEDSGTAFLASVSIPINVFDRNQGRIAEAKANLRAAQSDQTAQRFNLEKQAIEMWETLRSNREEVIAYQDGLLPSAEKAYSQAEAGFARGAFSFLDLLDAQRTLFDMQAGHLEALASFHETKAQIDMLSGTYTQMASAALNINTTEKE